MIDWTKKSLGLAIVIALPGSAASATNVKMRVTSAGAATATAIPCGAPLSYEVHGVLSDTANLGLAGMEFDLLFTGGPMDPADVPSDDPMLNFDRPAGIAANGSFGGTVVEGRLRHVGGAQNTLNNTDPPFPVGTVIPGVAHTETVLVTGSIITPSEPGTYVLSLSNIRATVLVGDDQATGYWAIEPAEIGTITNLTIEVLPAAGPPLSASNDGPACAGQYLTLHGRPDGMAEYAWTGPGGFASNEQNPVLASVLPGIYTLTVTDTNNCVRVTRTKVEVMPGACDPFVDCNNNGVYDGCEADSDHDGIIDDCDTPGCTPQSCDDHNDCTQDSCDTVAGCRFENLLSGTACGDGSDHACDHPDTCDGQGHCNVNLELSTTVCRSAAGECDKAEYCTGTSADCPPDGFAADGKSCGDPESGECDKPDSCDALGHCLTHLEPSTTLCRAAGECDIAEYCSGTDRKCPTDAFASPGASCGDRTETTCNHADSCDGSGHCQPNLAADGVSCSDNVFCNGVETCVSGFCTDQRDPCPDLQHCDEVHQSCLDCIADSECADSDLCTIDRCDNAHCVHSPDPQCTLRAVIEIKPGSCPTTVDPRSMRYLSVALLGNRAIDVGNVDARSLRLARTDGVGTSVAPTGQGSVRDISAPSPNDPCVCVFPTQRDGKPDLTMDFTMADLDRAMRLSSMPAGSSLTLALTGRLTNGSLFEAKDCITIRRALDTRVVHPPN